jgi:hypothetical protein
MSLGQETENDVVDFGLLGWREMIALFFFLV